MPGSAYLGDADDSRLRCALIILVIASRSDSGGAVLLAVTAAHYTRIVISAQHDIVVIRHR